MEQGVKFKKKIFATGASLAITIPPELSTFIDIKEGDEITLIGDLGKHGKYLAMFKEKKGR